MLRYIALIAAVGLLAGCEQPTPNATSEDRPYSSLSAKEKLAEEVGVRAVDAAQIKAAKRAAAAAFSDPRPVVFEDERAFDFHGEPTVCGKVRARSGTSLQRYIFRNGNAIVEKDVSSENFALFWQICEAGGA